MTKRIAIYGGTFDPVHFGHLKSIDALRRLLNLDLVRLIPSYIPPHRDEPGASSSDRLTMLELAAKDLEVEVDDREIRREGTSYSVDTLRELRDELGAGPELMFVLGSDAFALLHEWFNWESLTNYAHIIVMERPGLSSEVRDQSVLEWAETRIVDDVHALHGAGGNIARVALSPYDISATQIRRRITNGGDISELVPEAVANYIKQHKLYV